MKSYLSDSGEVSRKDVAESPIFKAQLKDNQTGTIYFISGDNGLKILGEYKAGLPFRKKMKPFFAVMPHVSSSGHYSVLPKYMRSHSGERWGIKDGPLYPATINLGPNGMLVYKTRLGYGHDTDYYELQPSDGSDLNSLSPEELLEKIKNTPILND